MLKHFIIATLMLTLCNTAFCAEFLIQAKDSPSETGAKIGDIIVVRPDGHQWGNAEGLPDYLVVKVPAVDYEVVKRFEDVLMVDDGVDGQGNARKRLARLRKFNVPLAWMQNKIDAGKSVVTISGSTLKTAFINAMREKTQ